MGLFRRRRERRPVGEERADEAPSEKPGAGEPSPELDPGTRYSYFGFLIGLLDRPSRKGPPGRGDGPTPRG